MAQQNQVQVLTGDLRAITPMIRDIMDKIREVGCLFFKGIPVISEPMCTEKVIRTKTWKRPGRPCVQNKERSRVTYKPIAYIMEKPMGNGESILVAHPDIIAELMDYVDDRSNLLKPVDVSQTPVFMPPAELAPPPEFKVHLPHGVARRTEFYMGGIA